MLSQIYLRDNREHNRALCEYYVKIISQPFEFKHQAFTMADEDEYSYTYTDTYEENEEDFRVRLQSALTHTHTLWGPAIGGPAIGGGQPLAAG